MSPSLQHAGKQLGTLAGQNVEIFLKDVDTVNLAYFFLPFNMIHMINKMQKYVFCMQYYCQPCLALSHHGVARKFFASKLSEVYQIEETTQRCSPTSRHLRLLQNQELLDVRPCRAPGGRVVFGGYWLDRFGGDFDSS